jgi:hypothetical protein
MKAKIKSKNKKLKFVKNIKDKSDEELLAYINEIGIEKYLLELTKIILSKFN